MDKNSGRIASNLGSDAASRIAMLNMSNPSSNVGGVKAAFAPRREVGITIFSPEQIEKRERDAKVYHDWEHH
jgi:hypothetical protein